MTRWCAEPHLPGHVGEPHFDCDMCGMTGHVRFRHWDALGRQVNVNHPDCMDLIPSVSPSAFLRQRWPFPEAPDSDASDTGSNRPWTRVA